MKLLVVGDVEGEFDVLFGRLKDLQQSAHGPFDACLCTGNFFGQKDETEELISKRFEYICTCDPPAIDIYFILGVDRKFQCLRTRLPKEGGLITPKVHFLGYAGIFNLSDATIAFVSGIQDTDTYRNEEQGQLETHTRENLHRNEVEMLLTESKKPLFTGVDLLLGAEWPHGFYTHVLPRMWPALENEQTALTVGATAMADLAAGLQPRYHFAANQGVFYQRPPYRNPADLASSQPNTSESGSDPALRHVSRFIGLGNVQKDAPKPKKYIHAFKLDPMANLTAEKLLQQPPGTTPNPYLEAASQFQEEATAGPSMKRARFNGGFSAERASELQQEEANAQNQFFYSLHGKYAGKRPRNKQEEQQMQQRRAERAAQAARFFRSDCFFCMSSPAFESHLVVSIAEESFLTLPKGPVNDNHILMVPIDHISRLAGAPASTHSEIAQFKLALRQYFAQKNLCLLLFERVVKTRHPAHTHIQAFGVKTSQVLGAAQAFIEHGKRIHADIQLLQDDKPITEDFAHADYYFYAEAYTQIYNPSEIESLAQSKNHNYFVGECIRLGCRIEPEQRFPVQFGRDVVCHLLGCPERKFWKDCAGTEAEETAQTENFRAQFSSFDITQEDDESDNE